MQTVLAIELGCWHPRRAKRPRRRRRGLLNDADDAICMLLTIIDRDPTLYLDELAEEMALVLNKAVRVHHVLRACKVCWLAFCSRVSSS